MSEALTQRHFDVWAAGGFLLTDRTPGLDIFPRELVEPIVLRPPRGHRPPGPAPAGRRGRTPATLGGLAGAHPVRTHLRPAHERRPGLAVGLTDPPARGRQNLPTSPAPAGIFCRAVVDYSCRQPANSASSFIIILKISGPNHGTHLAFKSPGTVHDLGRFRPNPTDATPTRKTRHEHLQHRRILAGHLESGPEDHQGAPGIRKGKGHA